MYEQIQEAVCLLNQEYLCRFRVGEEVRTQDLQKICRFLEEKCRVDGTVFVHGRGKRKSRNQRYLELFRRFLERQTIYDWHTTSFQGRNNYCKTDPDATFMHMKDDHMRNAQLKPGYNVQIAVDSEYIVATDIFQDRNDVWTLVPFLKDMETRLGFCYPSVTADSGYESEEAYEYLSEAGQKPYIKLQVEGAFGVLKNDYEFQRFLLRGKTRVKLEILLLCLGYNLNKLHAKIQNGRTGSHLFPLKETA